MLIFMRLKTGQSAWQSSDTANAESISAKFLLARLD
jgi:hypothetical protein